MPRFVFAYHGVPQPESEEKGARMMAEWQAWIERYRKQMPEPGNPVGMSKTVSRDGVADNGGANPLSGYSVVEVGTMDEAIDIGRDCPHVHYGGSIEIAEIMKM